MESELLAAVDFRVCKRLVVGNFGNWLGTRDAWTLKISVLKRVDRLICGTGLLL